MKLTVVGCGDAFGSGGQLQTCFHLASGDHQALIDCGATAVLGCNRLGLDLNRVSSIFISHLHGDHFAGLVWFLIHANHVSKRTTPLLVSGPQGIEARFQATAEALFPGSATAARKFDLRFVEYADGEALLSGPFAVTALEVQHPSGATPYGLRIEAAGKAVAFSGDTEWVPNLVPLSNEADLFIAECYGFREPARYHMSWDVIERQVGSITAKRLLLTHMSAEMLAHRDEVASDRVLIAKDGMVIEL